MVTMQVQMYQDASRTLLAQGFAELEQGDTRQASEKGWGATEQMLKSIAQYRGWEHRGHRLIRRVASRLAGETGDAEIRRLYRVADSLHSNFYEDLDTAEDVRAGLDDVGRLLDILAPFLDNDAMAEAMPVALYLVNPNSNVVHRDGVCGDVQNYGHNWNRLGYFAAIDDAVANSGGAPCGNCFPANA